MQSVVGYLFARPVIVVTINLFLLLAGCFAVLRLPVSLLPHVQLDSITVDATYPGATAELMDGRIASEIISAVSDINGIDYVSSQAVSERAQVAVALDVGQNLQQVLGQISERVRAISGFPDDMPPVEIRLAELDTAPDYALAFLSDQMSPAEVTDYLERVIKPQFQSLQGVGSVEVLGSEYAMRIWLDPEALTRHNLTALEISAALRSNNLQVNAGALRSDTTRMSIQVNSGLGSIEEFRNLPIGNGQTRLEDVARIELGARQPNIRSRFDGESATIMFVRWQEDSNPLVTGKSVRALTAELQSGFPYDLQQKVLVDNTSYIQTAISEVLVTIFVTAVIVMIVIYLGTGSLRAIAIPMVVIPLSLIGICAALLIAGFSINTLTLLAMVLAIGLVVDDAIVVLDASLYGLNRGQTPIQAAKVGLTTLAGPLVSITLTLAIAYIPIAFVGGLVGKLFAEFALTLAGAVILSGIVAVSLTPLMCSRFLSEKHASLPFAQRIEAVFGVLQRRYQRSLIHALRFRSLMLWLWLTCICAAGVLYMTTQRNLAPTEDQGSLMVFAQAPTSASIGFLDTQARQLEDTYSTLPGVENYNYVAGVPTENRLMSFLRLTDWKTRERSAMELQPLLQERLDMIPALQSVVIVPSSMPGSGGLPFQFVLKQSNRDYHMLDELSDVVIQRLRQSGMFAFARKNLDFQAPQIVLDIDRQLARKLGITADEVGFNISLAYANAQLQPFTYDGRTYKVVMQYDPQLNSYTDRLGGINLRTNSGQLVSLSALTSRSAATVPSELNRFQGQAAVTISGVLKPGVGLSEAADYVQELIDLFEARGVTTDLAGETRRAESENQRFQWTFLMAIMGTYFLLVWQFQSYRDPLIVLFGSVPLSAFGALITMRYLDIPLNIYTQIGLLTLCGLISKQGILVVQAANRQRENGRSQSLGPIIIRASGSRLRAIMLTSLTLVLGALPLLLAEGPASVSRFQLGVVIVSGMMLGPLLCMYLLPALYLVLAKAPEVRTGNIRLPGRHILSDNAELAGE